MEIELNKIILLLLLSSLIYYFSQKFKKFSNISIEPHQKFSSDELAVPIGGSIIFLFIFFFNFYFSFIEQLFLFLIFILGILSDSKIFNSPIKRLITQILIISIFVIYEDFAISDTRIDLIDSILDEKLINIVFTSFCILILINGSNFIDGLNGLVTGYYILITLMIVNLNLDINSEPMIPFLLVLLILLILNLFNKIYLGDNGSYLLGFMFAIIAISVQNKNSQISPYFIILLLWYPYFENLFSIIRKKILNKSSTFPDNKHFHQLLFAFLASKFKFKSKLILNNLTSIIILIFQIPIFIIGLKYFDKTNIQLMLICFSLVIYILTYLKLNNLLKSKNIDF